MSVRYVFRCEKNMGFWTRSRKAVVDLFSGVYQPVCAQEVDAERCVFKRTRSGVCKDVFTSWDWCGCRGGCRVEYDAIRPVGGSAGAVALGEVSSVGSLFAKEDS